MQETKHVMKQIYYQFFFSLISEFVVVRDVHKVTQWDEKGVMKIFEALKSVVSEYISDVQRVSLSKTNI